MTVYTNLNTTETCYCTTRLTSKLIFLVLKQLKIYYALTYLNVSIAKVTIWSIATNVYFRSIDSIITSTLKKPKKLKKSKLIKLIKL